MKKDSIHEGMNSVASSCCHYFSSYAVLSHSLLSLTYLQCMETQVLLKNNVQ